ncbi:hypothetical protein JKP88DRAFT_169934, partial [Tribonema minus]
HSVRFDAAFGSANLLRAVQRGPAEYDLFLRPDLHTHGHTQWFYFALSNRCCALARRPVSVTFNIVNLTKPDSLFSSGMRPVLYSHYERSGDALAAPGWRRCGENVAYRSNAPDGSVGAFYTLSFTVTFPWVGDTYRLAHCYPYTLADHARHMARIMADPERARHVARATLCHTLGGTACELLTITEDAAAFLAAADGEENLKCSREEIKCVTVSARVHPGETPASWMLRGILDYLTGAEAGAALLRRLFVFRVVPFLNPDGVAHGNNRCSLAGVDLNRQWRRPVRALHPTVHHLKALIRSEAARRGVAMYVDLHGHSRKQNIFLYGVDERRRGGLSRPSARVFPKLMSWNRLGGKYVSLGDCSFVVRKGREATARVVVARELSVAHSYTVESSFCGVDFGPLAGHHLNIDHLVEAGRAICESLLDMYAPRYVW